MTGPRAFHLGIIGGCAAEQWNIPHGQLYPQVLASQLRRATGADLKTYVARYADGEYERRLAEIAAGRRLDGVLLHVRTLVIRKTGLVVKYRSGDTMTYALHPILAGHGGRNWDEMEAAAYAGLPRMVRHVRGAGAVEPDSGGEPGTMRDASDRRAPGRRRPRLTLGRVNRFAGRLLGLERWALDDEAAAVARVHRACQALGARLLVLGPLPAPTMPWVEAFNERARHRMRDETARLGVEYCQFTPPNAAELMADGVHLDGTGHRMLAELLATVLIDIDWVAARS